MLLDAFAQALETLGEPRLPRDDVIARMPPLIVEPRAFRLPAELFSRKTYRNPAARTAFSSACLLKCGE